MTSPFKHGKVGSSLKSTQKVGNHQEKVLQDVREDRELVPETPVAVPQPPPHATVGLSLSVGMSTDFAREKIEVSGWCTLPCDPNDSSMQAAFDECFSQIIDQVDKRLQESQSHFFPYLKSNG